MWVGEAEHVKILGYTCVTACQGSGIVVGSLTAEKPDGTPAKRTFLGWSERGLHRYGG